MRNIGGKHPNGVNLAIRKSDLVIGDHVFDLRPFFLNGQCLLLNEVTGVFDAHIVHLGESGEVGINGDTATADNSNCFHNNKTPFGIFISV